MNKVRISLNTIDKVKSFSGIVAKHEPDMDIVSENCRYIIDAKSIMGIFSLDLSKVLQLNIHSDDEVVVNAVLKDIEAYIVKDTETV